MGRGQEDDTDVAALGRADLERLAWGPDADDAAAARARERLGLEGRPTSDRSAPDHRSAAPVPAAHGPHDRRSTRAPRVVTDADDAAPSLQSGSPDHAADAGAPLPDPAPTGLRGRRPGRPRWRLAALLAGTAVVAAGLGVGGTWLAERLGPAVVQDGASDSGSETLTRVLARAQTAEDEIPRTVDAAVDRSSARLLFANYADRPPVPWVVWVVDAASGDDVCIVASPDRYASDVTCLPRAEVLRGHVSYVTRDGAQGLSIRVDGGVARIDLIGGE